MARKTKQNKKNPTMTKNNDTLKRFQQLQIVIGKKM